MQVDRIEDGGRHCNTGAGAGSSLLRHIGRHGVTTVLDPCHFGMDLVLAPLQLQLAIRRGVGPLPSRRLAAAAAMSNPRYLFVRL